MSDQQDSASSGAGSSASSSSSNQVNVQQLKSQIANKFQTHRPLVLKLHSILTWEQDIYAAIVFAFVNFLFLVIHLLNSSVLTTLSYLGIIIALLDLAMPTLAKSLAASQSKTNDKDNQKFDKICLDLAKLYASIKGLCDKCCSLKTKKPKLYYPVLLGSLLVLAYIGNKINNLLLTYLVTLVVAFYPGLEKRGLVDKAVEYVYVTLGRRPPVSSSGDRRSSGKKN